MTDTFLATYKR